MLLAVSYFTDDTYASFAPGLRRSLDEFAIGHEIVPVPDRGSATLNKHYKPEFIASAMARHPGKDILWLDVDCVIVQRPSLLLEPAPGDFAASFWHGWFCYGGTLLFYNTEGSRRLLDLWTLENRERPTLVDDVNLTSVLLRHPPVCVRQLPLEYCWIERLHRPIQPDAVPVIRHIEVSTRAEAELKAKASR